MVGKVKKLLKKECNRETSNILINVLSNSTNITYNCNRGEITSLILLDALSEIMLDKIKEISDNKFFINENPQPFRQSGNEKEVRKIKLRINQLNGNVDGHTIKTVQSSKDDRKEKTESDLLETGFLISKTPPCHAGGREWLKTTPVFGINKTEKELLNLAIFEMTQPGVNDDQIFEACSNIVLQDPTNLTELGDLVRSAVTSKYSPSDMSKLKTAILDKAQLAKEKIKAQINHALNCNEYMHSRMLMNHKNESSYFWVFGDLFKSVLRTPSTFLISTLDEYLKLELYMHRLFDNNFNFYGSRYNDPKYTELEEFNGICQTMITNMDIDKEHNHPEREIIKHILSAEAYAVVEVICKLFDILWPFFKTHGSEFTTLDALVRLPIAPPFWNEHEIKDSKVKDIPDWSIFSDKNEDGKKYKRSDVIMRDHPIKTFVINLLSLDLTDRLKYKVDNFKIRDVETMYHDDSVIKYKKYKSIHVLKDTKYKDMYLRLKEEEPEPEEEPESEPEVEPPLRHSASEITDV